MHRPPDTTSVRIAVAYVTREGALRLIDSLRDRITGWDHITKIIVTCFDFGHTEPAALDLLINHGFVVRIANIGSDGVIKLQGQTSSYHPKIYFFETDDEVSAVIGSANLSRRALSVNDEAVTTVMLDAEHAWQLWDQFESGSVPLTDVILSAYRELRIPQRAVRILDEPQVPAPRPPAQLPVFREAVEAGTIDPATFKAMWVDVGGPSGGSGSQLELPRRAQRFFGFHFDNYDDGHYTIGNPVLRTATGQWARPLTWHGNNRMERINFPTPTTSGLQYAHRVVLFERLADKFQITVEDRESTAAQSWRSESAAAGTLFRISPGSQRLCGLL